MSGLLVGAAVTITLVGCSLMVSFEDPGEAPDQVVVRRDSGKDRNVPGDDDDDATSSSSSSSTSSSGSSSSSSSSSSSGAPVFPPACENIPALAGFNCEAKTLPNCGANFTTLPAGIAPTDLIDCTDGVPKCVRKCPNGCTKMPNGNSDQCDDCNGKKDGIYCDRDLKGFPGDNAKQWAVECKGNASIKVSFCGDGVGGICQSACTRTSPPPVFPSCCTVP